MKLAVNIIRIFVGILFIVSGLVKANDPLGLSYKMQEFFEIWSAGISASQFFLKTPLLSFFGFLHNQSLALSIIMIMLEVVAGVALLIGWQRRLVVNLLFILILFFTFLTAYAYLSGKFKNCGCFGDCIPITPLTSFLKDVLLLVMILFLLFRSKYIQPVATAGFRSLFMVGVLLFSLGLQWYVLNYLPIADCLPFKEGKSITEGMKIPTGALPDSFAIRFVYEKEGKQYEFSPTDLPADLASYQFVDRIDKLVRKGNAEPPIKGFALLDSTGTDVSSTVLNQLQCLLLFCENFKGKERAWINGFKKVYENAKAKGIPVYLATAASYEVTKSVFSNNGLNDIPVYTCDNTIVRTAARTNPTLYFLKEGGIIEKYSYRQIEEANNQIVK